MKKHKIKNEDPSINFRVPELLKIDILREAAFLNKTVSTYLRDLLTEYLDGSLYRDEIAFYERNEFINNTEFIQLVIWMYSKRNNKKCTSTPAQLDDYIKTLKKIDGNLPDEFVSEFDKVLEDVLRVKKETSDYKKEYKFCQSSHFSPGFDYGKLEDYLLNEVKATYRKSYIVKV
jgi:hypothetical protein